MTFKVSAHDYLALLPSGELQGHASWQAADGGAKQLAPPGYGWEAPHPVT